MKVRGATTGTPFAARLTVLCWGALTLLAPVAVSACTSSSSTTTPTIISPTVTNSPRDGHGVGLRRVGNVALVQQHVADRHARRRLVDRSARGDRDANDHHDPH